MKVLCIRFPQIEQTYQIFDVSIRIDTMLLGFGCQRKRDNVFSALMLADSSSSSVDSDERLFRANDSLKSANNPSISAAKFRHGLQTRDTQMIRSRSGRNIRICLMTSSSMESNRPVPGYKKDLKKKIIGYKTEHLISHRCIYRKLTHKTTQ